MLLQPTIPKSHSPPNYAIQNQIRVCASDAVSFQFQLLQNSSFLLKPFILSTSRIAHEKIPLFIARSSISQVRSYGKFDYNNRSTLKWNAIFWKISLLENPNSGAASVLNQVENEGNDITKWELSKVVKELRKFRRYTLALEVCEWMNNRPDRFRLTTSDTAIELDLIAKVHGILNAEQYFEKLPDSFKDNRAYGSLLNVYARSKTREKAESLMQRMRNRNYANQALPFNVMMTLYMNLKDHDKLELLISEMTEKNISLDMYTYNIWLSSCGSQGLLDKMEQVFRQMELDAYVNPNWTTFSAMATVYMKSGHLDKVEGFLKKIEDGITGRDRMPYHHLISLNSSAGRKGEVYRIWNIYKASFATIPNRAYRTMISALIRLDDVEGAEKVYDEWLSVRSSFDARVGNLLLGSYVSNGLSEKAGAFFERMMEVGGKPNSASWEILSEDHIANGRIGEALSCLKNATSVVGPTRWKPKPANMCKIMEVVGKGGEVVAGGKELLREILSQVGCADNEAYVPVWREEGEDGEFVLPNQLQTHESLSL